MTLDLSREEIIINKFLFKLKSSHSIRIIERID